MTNLNLVSKSIINSLRHESLLALVNKQHQRFHLIQAEIDRAEGMYEKQMRDRISGYSLLPKHIQDRAWKGHFKHFSTQEINKWLCDHGYQKQYRINGKPCYEATEITKDFGIGVNDPTNDNYHRVYWSDEVVYLIANNIHAEQLGEGYVEKALLRVECYQ